ncbi:hypothetical protein LCGC14_1850650, partial [marine sediment metagenome]
MSRISVVLLIWAFVLAAGLFFAGTSDGA